MSAKPTVKRDEEGVNGPLEEFVLRLDNDKEGRNISILVADNFLSRHEGLKKRFLSGQKTDGERFDFGICWVDSKAELMIDDVFDAEGPEKVEEQDLTPLGLEDKEGAIRIRSIWGQ